MPPPGIFEIESNGSESIGSGGSDPQIGPMEKPLELRYAPGLLAEKYGMRKTSQVMTKQRY